MPLHMTGMASRRSLEFGDEEPVKIAAPALERVLKFNPNHDPQTGRFTEGPGLRRGGTVGAPTEDAFGRAFGRPRRSAEAAAFGGGPSLPAQRAAETYRKMRAGEGGLGYTKSPGSGFTTRGALSRGGAVPMPNVSGGTGRAVPMPHHGGTGGGGPKPVPMPNVEGKDVTAPKGQYFDEYGVLQETNPRRSAEAKAFHTPGALSVPKQFQFSEAEKRRNYKVMFGHHPGSMDKNGKPTKRSSFS